MSKLSLININLLYNSKTIAGLHKFSADFKQGSLNFLLGPSGSGKTSLLKMINGEIKPDSGEIFGNTQVISHQEILGDILQNKDQLVLKYLSKLDDTNDLSKARDFLYDFHITHTHQRKISNLSNGEFQRVVLSACLLSDAKIITFDEVFHGIDFNNRQEIFELLITLARKSNKTFIFASQLLFDALSFADQIILFQHGSISAKGTPESLYNRPPNQFCAKFWGPVNLFVHSNYSFIEPFAHYPREDREKLIMLKPEFIKLSQDSKFKASVSTSRSYMGKFLTKANFKDQLITLITQDKLEGEISIDFEVEKAHILDEV